MTGPELAFNRLALDKSLFVPIALKQVLSSKEIADFRRCEAFAFVLVVNHNVEQGLERWTRLGNASIIEIHLRNAPLRGDNIFDSVHENS